MAFIHSGNFESLRLLFWLFTNGDLGICTAVSLFTIVNAWLYTNLFLLIVIFHNHIRDHIQSAGHYCIILKGFIFQQWRLDDYLSIKGNLINKLVWNIDIYLNWRNIPLSAKPEMKLAELCRKLVPRENSQTVCINHNWPIRIKYSRVPWNKYRKCLDCMKKKMVRHGFS